MIKNLLRLLATSTSFLALLLITNTAMAATPANSFARAQLPSFSLNVISPSLQFVSSDRHNLLDRSGCSCAVCQRIDRVSSYKKLDLTFD